MTFETIRSIAEMIGYAAGVLTVLFMAVQLRVSRKLEEYKTLQRLEEKFTHLLWRASGDKQCDEVWVPLKPERKAAFSEALKKNNGNTWPVWDAMNGSERSCYRFTRSGLEIFEQAYMAYRRKWVSDREIWGKWKAWMLSWKRSNEYLPYVTEELKMWFTPSFLEYIKKIDKSSTG